MRAAGRGPAKVACRLRESCHLDLVALVPTSPPAPLLLRGVTVATLLSRAGVASMESVREAGFGCRPVPYGICQGAEGSGFCLPTRSAIGNSEPLNAPPYTQKPDIGHVSEWRKFVKRDIGPAGRRGCLQTRSCSRAGGTSVGRPGALPAGRAGSRGRCHRKL